MNCKNLKEDLQKAKKMSDSMSKLSDYIGIETKVGEFMCRAIDNYINLLVKHYENNNENSWIKWFVFENDFGRDDLLCYIEGKKIEINNINDFVKFFEEYISE